MIFSARSTPIRGLRTAQPRAEARPVIEAAGEADRDRHHHDARVFLAEVNDSGHRENDGRESQNDAPPAHIERALLDGTPEFDEAYDEPTILRNEANVSVVGCQSSVVPCEFEAINEANVSVVSCQSSVVRSEFEAINEANVSVVSCPSSVVGSEVEAINEPNVSVVSRRLSVPKRRVNRHGCPRAPSRAPVRPTQPRSDD